MLVQNVLEKLVGEIDAALRTLVPPKVRLIQRPNPAENLDESLLEDNEKKQVARLMRVNHAGEVCAQALYRGQALSAQSEELKLKFKKAALEESDHLAWCEARLTELNSRPSVLNPFWYFGSLTLGIISGLAGDRLSLSFLAETERQVTEHLNQHIQQLPLQDKKTKLLLEQMKEDEMQHATQAFNAGARELPYLIKLTMTGASKIMTHLSYYI